MNWGMPAPLWTEPITIPMEDTMSLNVGEAHTVNRVLDWVDILHQSGQEIPGDVRAELVKLTEGAYRRLQGGWQPNAVAQLLAVGPGPERIP
jgi:hypothetical protein